MLIVEPFSAAPYPMPALSCILRPARFGFVAALLLTCLLIGPGRGSLTQTGANMALEIRSTAFAHNGEVPTKYTCEGKDVAPPLEWSGVPPGTESLALIVDDPDAPDPRAPRMTWVHWVIYNLPPDLQGLSEGGALPAGARDGLNDWKRTGYGGPCPPIGRHRYFHKLYALDVLLPDLRTPTKAKLEAAMEGHILARAELIGTYQKKR